jgi:hypothetical protein
MRLPAFFWLNVGADGVDINYPFSVGGLTGILDIAKWQCQAGPKTGARLKKAMPGKYSFTFNSHGK